MLKIDENGDRIWKNEKDQFHRIDGPAIERSNGNKSWYVNGYRHRVDGPAMEFGDGTKVWCIHGKRHRVDGPAVEWANGGKTWYLDDVAYNKNEYLKIMEKK